VYQSVYLLIALVPWLAAARSDLLRYAKGFVLLSGASFACFLFFPVACPRPESIPTTGMFAWLARYDGPTNTIPSLHVGLATFTLLFGGRTSRDAIARAARRRLLGVGAAWAAAIAYAALATKQHYAIDLPAGLLAAWLAFRWAFASRARRRERVVLGASPA
jgi:membrane-associated phospholipid phosphatase